MKGPHVEASLFPRVESRKSTGEWNGHLEYMMVQWVVKFQSIFAKIAAAVLLASTVYEL